MHGTIGLKDSAAVVAPPIADTPKLPEFKSRWWHRQSRLDVRPVIWSIYNHPEEWTPTRYCMFHKPSRHEFWVGGRPHLWRANCGCNSHGGYFQLFQGFAFKRAVRWWRNQQMNIERFADHFVH